MNPVDEIHRILRARGRGAPARGRGVPTGRGRGAPDNDGTSAPTPVIASPSPPVTPVEPTSDNLRSWNWAAGLHGGSEHRTVRISCLDAPSRSAPYAVRIVATTPGTKLRPSPEEEHQGHALVDVPAAVEDQLLCGAAMRRLPVPASWGRVVVSRCHAITGRTGGQIASCSFEESRAEAIADAEAVGVTGHDPVANAVGPATTLVRQLFPDVATLQADLEDEMLRYVDAVADAVTVGTGGEARAAELRLLLLNPPGALCDRCCSFEHEGRKHLPGGHDVATPLSPSEEGRAVLHRHEYRPLGEHRPLRLPRFVKLFRDSFEATHRDVVRSLSAIATVDDETRVGSSAESEGCSHDGHHLFFCFTGKNKDGEPKPRFLSCEAEIACIDGSDGSDGKAAFGFRAEHEDEKAALKAERKRLRKLKARGGDVEEQTALCDRFEKEGQFDFKFAIYNKPRMITRGVRFTDRLYSHGTTTTDPSVPTRWSTLSKLVRHIAAPVLLRYDPSVGALCRCEQAAVGHAATLLCHVVIELMSRQWDVLPGSDAAPTADGKGTTDLLTTKGDVGLDDPGASVLLHAGFLTQLLSMLETIAGHSEPFFFEDDVRLCGYALHTCHRSPKLAVCLQIRAVDPQPMHDGQPKDDPWPPCEGATDTALTAALWSSERDPTRVNKAAQLAILHLAAVGDEDMHRESILRFAALSYSHVGSTCLPLSSLDEFVERVFADSRRVIPWRSPLVNLSGLGAETDFLFANTSAAEINVRLLEQRKRLSVELLQHAHPSLVEEQALCRTLFWRFVRAMEQPPLQLQVGDNYRTRGQWPAPTVVAWAEGVDTRPPFVERTRIPSQEPVNDYAANLSDAWRRDLRDSIHASKTLFATKAWDLGRFLDRLVPRHQRLLYKVERALEFGDVATNRLCLQEVLSGAKTYPYEQDAQNASYLDVKWASHLIAAIMGQPVPEKLLQRRLKDVEFFPVFRAIAKILMTPATAHRDDDDPEVFFLAPPASWLTAELPAYHLMTDGFYNLAARVFEQRALHYRGLVKQATEKKDNGGEPTESNALADALRCELAAGYCALSALGDGADAVDALEARRPAYVALASVNSELARIEAMPDARPRAHFFEVLHALEGLVSTDVARAIDHMHSPFIDALPGHPAGATFMALHAAAVSEVGSDSAYTELLLVLDVVLDAATPIRTRLALMHDDVWQTLPQSSNAKRATDSPGAAPFLSRVLLQPGSIQPSVARLLYALCYTVFPGARDASAQVLAASRHKPDLGLVSRFPPAPNTPDPPGCRDLSADGLKARGNQVFAQGKAPLAISYYHAALGKLEVHQSDAASVVCSNLSLAYLTIRDAHGAHVMAAAAIGLAPAQPKPWLRAAQAAHAFPFRHAPSRETVAGLWSVMKDRDAKNLPRDSVLEDAVAVASKLRDFPLRSAPPSCVEATPRPAPTAQSFEFNRVAAAVTGSPGGVSPDLDLMRPLLPTIAGMEQSVRSSDRSVTALLLAVAARYGLPDRRTLQWMELMKGFCPELARVISGVSNYYM